MRIGLLGPARNDVEGLARAASALLDKHAPDRVVYLGDDDLLDHVIEDWARQLVGGEPTRDTVYARAARAADAAPPELDQLVEGEAALQRLRLFRTLPQGKRTIELLGGRVTLFVYDKATLDEEDISAASLLVFGKGDAPTLRRVGSRTFVSPGAVSLRGGSALLEERDADVYFTAFDAAGRVVIDEPTGAPMGRLRVQ
jgi:hypothetical protein